MHEALAVYRPVATRAAVMFFVMDGLPALDRVYLFSMAAFVQASELLCWRLGLSRVFVWTEPRVLQGLWGWPARGSVVVIPMRSGKPGAPPTFPPSQCTGAGDEDWDGASWRAVRGRWLGVWACQCMCGCAEAARCCLALGLGQTPERLELHPQALRILAPPLQSTSSGGQGSSDPSDLSIRIQSLIKSVSLSLFRWG